MTEYPNFFARVHSDVTKFLKDQDFQRSLFLSKNPNLVPIQESIVRFMGANIYALGKNAVQTYGLESHTRAYAVHDRMFLEYYIDARQDCSPHVLLNMYTLESSVDNPSNYSIEQMGVFLFLQRPTLTQKYLYRRSDVNPRKHVCWPGYRNTDTKRNTSALMEYLMKHSDIHDYRHLDSPYIDRTNAVFERTLNMFVEQIQPRKKWITWQECPTISEAKSLFLAWLSQQLPSNATILDSGAYLSRLFISNSEAIRLTEIAQSMSLDSKAFISSRAFTTLREDLQLSQPNTALEMDFESIPN